MYDTAAAILKAAKAEILPYDADFMGMPGQAIHEHSTCRMGADPKRSRAERVLPDARREECVRRGRRGVYHGVGEESDADDSGAGMARDGLSGGEMKASRL